MDTNIFRPFIILSGEVWIYSFLFTPRSDVTASNPKISFWFSLRPTSGQRSRTTCVTFPVFEWELHSLEHLKKTYPLILTQVRKKCWLHVEWHDHVFLHLIARPSGCSSFVLATIRTRNRISLCDFWFSSMRMLTLILLRFSKKRHPALEMYCREMYTQFEWIKYGRKVLRFLKTVPKYSALFLFSCVRVQFAYLFCTARKHWLIQEFSLWWPSPGLPFVSSEHGCDIPHSNSDG